LQLSASLVKADLPQGSPTGVTPLPMKFPQLSQVKAEILLVDDQPDTLRLLSIMLNSQGYLVKRVTTGAMALKAVMTSHPDLILLDIRMPGIDGYEVCQRLKADEATQNIPIIFLSALNDTLDKVKAFNIGGADYVTKPFEFAEVLARVENQLQICSLQKQLQLKNETLVEEVQRRQKSERSLLNQAQKDQALNRVIQEIHKSMELETVFFTAISEIGRLLKLDFANIMNYSPQEKIWLSVAEYRQFQHSSGLLSLSDEGNPITAKLKSGEMICLDSAGQLTDHLHQTLAKRSTGAWLIMPLQVGHDVWGGLCLLRQQPSPWQESEIESAEALAQQLAIAIQQAELYKQLQAANFELGRLATLDGLTQVPNRRHFNQYLELQWREAHREQTSLSIILCDVDHFKKYNDTYGHLAGDDCLKAVAHALRCMIKRPDDLAARYGGEEFAMILPRTDLTGAAHIAESIRQQVYALREPHSSSDTADVVTLSLGVASMVPSSLGQQGYQELINRADQALYKAKETGRNRISLYGLASVSHQAA